MNSQERRQYIINQVQENPRVRAKEIAQTLGITPQWVWQIIAQSEARNQNNAPAYQRTRVCPSCGNPKHIDATQCRRCHSRARASKRTCPFCGNRKYTSSKRCAKCHVQYRKSKIAGLGHAMSLTCGICHSPFERRTSEIVKRKGNQSKMVVCSTRCRAINAARHRIKE